MDFKNPKSGNDKRDRDDTEYDDWLAKDRSKKSRRKEGKAKRADVASKGKDETRATRKKKKREPLGSRTDFRPESLYDRMMADETAKLGDPSGNSELDAIMRQLGHGADTRRLDNTMQQLQESDARMQRDVFRQPSPQGPPIDSRGLVPGGRPPVDPGAMLGQGGDPRLHGVMAQLGMGSGQAPPLRAPSPQGPPLDSRGLTEPRQAPQQLGAQSMEDYLQ